MRAVRANRRGLAFAATILLGGIGGALAGAGPAAAAGSSAAGSSSAAASPAAAAAPTAPPPVSVLTDQPGFGRGDALFVTPTGDTSTYAQGPEILSTSGQELWFKATPAGTSAADFRTQTYHGQTVLTWFQGTTNALGQGNGEDFIYSTSFEPIATVKAGNGQSADAHEFYITPQNTALITVYKPATADLTSIGGPADQAVTDGVVQEIDIATGKVLWEWNSAEHVPYSASENPLPASASEPWDWFHINAVRPNTNEPGTYLVDSRDTWAAYDVDRHTGNVNWTLGGKDSSFTLKAAPGQSLDNAGEIFTWQHDPEPLGGDLYSVYDDEGAPSEGPVARAVKIRLDFRDHVATLVASYDQPEGLVGSSQGNAQTLPGGNLLVGWGNLPYLSAFGPFGNLVYNLQFPEGVNSYRAFLQPWPVTGHGHGGPGFGGPGFGGPGGFGFGRF